MSLRSLSRLQGEAPANAVPPPPFRWGTRVVLPGALIAGLAALLAGSLWASLSPVVGVAVLPVVERPSQSIAAAPSDTSSVVAQAAGWIEPDPFPVSVSALASGTVREVLVLEGDAVARGEVLVRLVDEDARLSLQRAEADLAAAEETWEANIESTRALAVASAAVSETSSSLALARADLAGEEALRAEAERTRRRNIPLHATGSLSDSEYTASETDFRLREARVDAARHRIEELNAQLARARANEVAAQRHAELRTEERRALELARVAADEARLRLDRMQIAAPIDGVVMRRLVEPGSRVVVGSDDPGAAHVAQLYDPARLQVRVDVPLADAARIGVGQSASITVEVLPDRVFHGTVTRVTHLADIQKNTLQVKVSVRDPSPELKPEMLARVRFHAVASADAGNASRATAVFVPKEAVDDNAVWVVANYDGREGIAERREVTLVDASTGDWREVAQGVRPGDLVVVAQDSPLTAGARVRVRTGEE